MSETKPLEPLGPGDDLGPYRIHRRLRSPFGTELYQVGDRRNPEILLTRLEVYVPEPFEVDFFTVRWVLTLERLHHVSPEETRALPLIPASDVASLGSVLYRLLSAIHPYRAASRLESLHLAMKGRSTPLRSIRPDVPELVAQLIHRMMAVDPSERPADGEAAALAIEDTAAELGIPLGAKVVRRARRRMSLHWQ